VALAALLAMMLLGPRVETASDAGGKLLFGRNVSVPASDPVQATPAARVWRIEEKPDHEAYSNGLRIERRFVAPHYPRAYSVYPLDLRITTDLEVRTQPAGIVFHTTESPQAPLEEGYTRDLKRITQDTLRQTRRNHSYHFVIDRFGRVFRVVPETDVAFHAGKSVWADESGIYFGLNDSFLGVSFEAQTIDVGDGMYLNQPQIQSARLLVPILLEKYRIPPANCITHSQVSVNADNMKIGNHTDGAGDFPFQQLGLPDNYAQPLPSIYRFGFEYDLVYLKSTGFRLWKGLLQSDERIREAAMARRLSIREYKRTLRDEYRKITAALELRSALEEKKQ
jgi:hypothetical protein